MIKVTVYADHIMAKDPVSVLKDYITKIMNREWENPTHIQVIPGDMYTTINAFFNIVSNVVGSEGFEHHETVLTTIDNWPNDHWSNDIVRRLGDIGTFHGFNSPVKLVRVIDDGSVRPTAAYTAIPPLSTESSINTLFTDVMLVGAKSSGEQPAAESVCLTGIIK